MRNTAMRLFLMLLLLLSLTEIALSQRDSSSTSLEPLTPENVQWLVPLVSTRTGDIQRVAWLPGEKALAIEVLTGVWVFPTEIVNRQPVVAKANGKFYRGLSQITLNETRNRLVALEIIPDIRPDQPSYANVWDVSTGEVISELTDVTNIAGLSPDGQTVVVREEAMGARLFIYSLQSGQRTAFIDAPANVTGFGFSYDGRFLAMTGHYATIDSFSNPYLMIYDLTAQAQFVLVHGTEDQRVESYFVPQFSPDNQFIVLTNGFTAVQYWQFDQDAAQLVDVTDELKSLNNMGDDDGFVMLPDNQVLALHPAVTMSGVKVYENAELSEQQLTFSNPRSIRYDPDGNLLYYANSDGSFAPLETFGAISLIPRPNEVSFYKQVISPDGVRVIGVSNDSLTLVNLRHPGYLFNSERLNSTIWFTTVSQDFEIVMYTPYNAANQGLGDTVIQRTDTGEILATLPALRKPIFSPDARLVAGIAEAGALRVWDLGTGKEIAAFSLATTQLISEPFLAFSPDSTTLAAIRDDRLRLWDIARGNLQIELELQLDYLAPDFLRYSNDGQWLALFGERNMTDEGVFLWRVADLLNGTLSASTYTYQLKITRQPTAGFVVELVDNGSQLDESLSLSVEQSQWDAVLRFLHSESGEPFAEFFVLPWEYSLDLYQGFNRTQNTAGTLYALKNSSAIYDAVTDRIVAVIGENPNPYHQIEFDPAGQTLATTNGITATVWGVPAVPNDPQAVSCAGAPTPQLQVGRSGVLTGPNGLREVRIRAYPNGTIIGSLASYTSVTVVRGPICENGILWWGIETADKTLRGWIAEALSAEDYLIIPG